MTDCSITPSFDLVTQWAHESPIEYSDESWAYELFIAHKAVQWGADQELEACCEWLENQPQWMEDLRAARRPKPPSPKEEALQVLEALIESRRIIDPEYQALRHALEQLDD